MHKDSGTNKQSIPMNLQIFKKAKIVGSPLFRSKMPLHMIKANFLKKFLSIDKDKDLDHTMIKIISRIILKSRDSCKLNLNIVQTIESCSAFLLYFLR